MTHQISVPDDVWEWAQDHTGQTKPASFLRQILIKSMCFNGAAVQTQPVIATKMSMYIKRWAALGLEKEPSDTRYHAARRLWISEHDSELEALEAIEKVAQELTRDETRNMRGWLIWWSRQVTAS